MNSNKNNLTAALIVAAGRGHRFGGPLPKQYTDLGGKMVLNHTVSALLAHPDIDMVRCVIHPDDQSLYENAVSGLSILSPVSGGATRQDSVRLGLESLEDQNIDKILIHDGARPFVSLSVIDGVLDALNDHAGAVAALAVADTLKRGKDAKITQTVSRDGLWRAQTPQGFHLKDILAAHHKFAGEELTDDTQLFERLGLEVILTQGSHDNFKITTGEDLMRAENLLAHHTETRTGMGFDAHRFDKGDFVTLCGLEIPHDFGLKGHSDADVALHALTDALLGAIGAGDIGQHFPPSDAKWKGAKSDQFVQHATSLMRERGGEIINVDLTIICEAPKIGPHRESMVKSVANILGVDQHRVSVKATTTEGMGFTGRKEGIAAQAIATVRLKTLKA
ncbi:MAG: bifunctional 2-C-methyl-D-erythritol 4-phosphate cytidylyltransferase/2-C-methyl-D-erythritol 2,4-cyclodiphosphate synthase [Rhodospirillaceae bacterium]|nr:MAG: bifunctional 2-C-methyl-D-erythritol 4-phosphate cytidylyltransferase/2-C-methyl-D-erythritol 2,4-cyclodiphosphate synthase [Rhodospirillaceae bacterium]